MALWEGVLSDGLHNIEVMRRKVVLLIYSPTSRDQFEVIGFNLGLVHPAWMQSTLPMCHGGLGIQSAVQLAPSAILAPLHTCRLIQLATMQPPQFSYVHKALCAWS